MAAKQKRGFAVMSRKRLAEIARMGGKEAHKCGTAHEFCSKDGRAAGLIGGKRLARKRGRRHMAMIGRRGGVASGISRRFSAAKRVCSPASE